MQLVLIQYDYVKNGYTSYGDSKLNIMYYFLSCGPKKNASPIYFTNLQSAMTMTSGKNARLN